MSAPDPTTRMIAAAVLLQAQRDMHALAVQSDVAYANVAAGRNAKGGDVRWFHLADGKFELPVPEAANGEAA